MIIKEFSVERYPDKIKAKCVFCEVGQLEDQSFMDFICTHTCPELLKFREKYGDVKESRCNTCKT